MDYDTFEVVEVWLKLFLSCGWINGRLGSVETFFDLSLSDFWREKSV